MSRESRAGIADGPARLPLDAFDYELPPGRIAGRPAVPRDASRLMVLDRSGGVREHATFRDLDRFLRAGDLLVYNDTRVRPVRLRGRRPGGGDAELLLVRRIGADDRGEVWSCLVRPARRLRPGTRVQLPAGVVATCLAGDPAEEARPVRFTAARPLDDILEEIGEVPLPPYLARSADDEDRERYQTVYARVSGSAAAPTAGFHFTPELLGRLRAGGIELRALTLHVGPGTFLPVRTADANDHRMLPEEVDVPAETADAVRRAHRAGRRVIAVGTTTVRALEGAELRDREGYRGPVSIFIRPGFRFRLVDGLVTNFHLPRSTLLMLVCAFAGRERILGAYREAVSRGYRFYSYGDAMLIL